MKIENQSVNNVNTLTSGIDVGQKINIGPGKFGNKLRSFKSETPLTFIYSEKATKFCEIFLLLLTVCTGVKRFRRIV